MRKQEFEKKEMLSEWIESTGRDSAPQGFSHRVMTRIELEPISSIDRYSIKTDRKFFLLVTSVFIILIAFALFLPGSEGTFFSRLSSFSIPEINFPEITMPSINLPFQIPVLYPFLIIGVSGLLLFFDRFLNKVFKRI